MDAELLTRLLALQIPDKHMMRVLAVLSNHQPQQSATSAAIRKRRERDKKRDMSRDSHATVTPNPSPSPLSPTPPIPTPPPGHPPVQARVRPSLEQAKAAATMIGVTPQQAETWWLAREASEWLRSSNGSLMPVGQNWQADMRTFTNNSAQRQAESAPSRRNDSANAPGRYA